MWTINHRGYVIQGYFTTEVCRVENPDRTFLGLYNTKANAKRAINRRIAKDRQLLKDLTT